jgi:Lar family restriction alleviation protein
MNTDLKPCPHCGSTITEGNILRGRHGGTVWCVECGAHGPDACGGDEAIIAAWNRRASDPDPIDPRD